MNFFTKIALGLQVVSGTLTTISQTLPIVPSWLPLAIAGVGVLSTLMAKLAPAGITPTPNLTVDDTGPALGKASGEAGVAAGKGPFKP